VPGKRRPQAGRRKRSRRPKSRAESRLKHITRKTPRAPVSRLSKRSLAARERAIHALRDMRRGVSPTQSLRNNGVTLRTFKKYLASEIRQDRPGGRINVTKGDRRVRYLQLPGLHGPIDTDTHGSREASRAAKYKADVTRALGGDVKALNPWKGKRIAGVELITDLETLKRLAQDQLLPYALYRSFSGGGT